MNEAFLALIYEVEALLLKGKPLDLVVDGLAAGDPAAKPEPRPPVSPELIRKAAAECVRRWCDDAGTKDAEVARQLRTLRHLYDRSYRLNDFKTCVSISVEIEKLVTKHGLGPKAPAAAGPKAKPLTPKRAAFVQEYVIDHNATQAAIRSGYSPKAAGAIGFDLLKIPEIQFHIKRLEAEAEARAEVSKDWILRGLKREATMPGPAGPRVRAFELLGKNQGLFADRLVHENPDGSPLGPRTMEVVFVDPPARDTDGQS